MIYCSLVINALWWNSVLYVQHRCVNICYRKFTKLIIFIFRTQMQRYYLETIERNKPQGKHEFRNMNIVSSTFTIVYGWQICSETLKIYWKLLIIYKSWFGRILCGMDVTVTKCMIFSDQMALLKKASNPNWHSNITERNEITTVKRVYILLRIQPFMSGCHQEWFQIGMIIWLDSSELTQSNLPVLRMRTVGEHSPCSTVCIVH